MASDLLQRLGEHPDVTVEISSGIEHWERGEIVLSVSGSGDAEVLNRRAGEQRRFTGRVDAEGLAGLGNALAGLELPGRAGATEPDDVPVKVAVRRDGRTLAGGEAWYSRRYDDARLDDLLRRYDAIVEVVTAGQLG